MRLDYQSLLKSPPLTLLVGSAPAPGITIPLHATELEWKIWK